jgi:hypothetical protein
MSIAGHRHQATWLGLLHDDERVKKQLCALPFLNVLHLLVPQALVLVQQLL